MKKLYEVTAWRPETHTTSDTFEADTPEDALTQAKAAFLDESGDSCYSGEAWDEFLVSSNGEQVLVESPPNHEAKLLEALKALTEATSCYARHFHEHKVAVAVIAEATGRAA